SECASSPVAATTAALTRHWWDTKPSASGRKRAGRPIRPCVVHIYEGQSELRIVGQRSPVRAAQRRRKRDDRCVTKRARERTARLKLVCIPEIRAEFLNLRRHLVNVVSRHSHSRDGTRLQRKWLSRP